MLICLPIVYGYFCTAVAALSSCDKDYMSGKAETFLFVPLQKVLTPCLNSKGHELTKSKILFYFIFWCSFPLEQ